MSRGVGFSTDLRTEGGAITIGDREDGRPGVTVRGRGQMTLAPAQAEEVIRVLSRYLEASRNR